MVKKSEEQEVAGINGQISGKLITATQIAEGRGQACSGSKNILIRQVLRPEIRTLKRPMNKALLNYQSQVHMLFTRLWIIMSSAQVQCR